ncbi:hypothetical protein CAPTEDRAFT_195623 [Capitella teleta]|uniref:Uncharacterized protein n=1 Tax=Capitella teleta TaxID=283909 RepID=R7VE02_CAPTE|nr:hypothetical protein CAPTEDRAFT_195623 [Capitella teleta]|eukprot:ELU16854.1 hypothetical protein CAPTEDRAFT_195623 [Capitella teleta]
MEIIDPALTLTCCRYLLDPLEEELQDSLKMVNIEITDYLVVKLSEFINEHIEFVIIAMRLNLTHITKVSISLIPMLIFIGLDSSLKGRKPSSLSVISQNVCVKHNYICKGSV